MEILLIEDNPVDAWITQETLSACGIPIKVHYLPEGEAALGFLNQVAPFQAAVTPDLILLDLHMTGMGGVEFLKNVKNVPRLKNIPVVILSTSSHPKDIEETYQFKAIAYLNKPIQLEEIVLILNNLPIFSPRVKLIMD
ncbi:MAG: response regulator [Bacteroidota bacterium]